MGESDVLIEARGLVCEFDVSPPWLDRVLQARGRRTLKALDDVSFSIRRGETFGLVGESGCGKSTAARLLCGLLIPTRGSVLIGGIDLQGNRGARQARLRRQMQMIFQDPYASLNPRWRVRDIVAEPLRVHGLVRGRSERDARVRALLTQVKLSQDDADKYPHEFSGGQRQRISIARALSSNPGFLICDEPTSALDVSVQAQILNLMADLQRQFGLTYLLISHNLAVVSHVATRVAVMYLGRIVEIGDTRRIFSQPLHPYTQMLLSAVPDLGMNGKARTPVAGEVPNPLDPPTGCAFHPRCPIAMERCKHERPILSDHPAGGAVACHAVHG
jgi:peptide/nickel transport system ATP-binding protein